MAQYSGGAVHVIGEDGHTGVSLGMSLGAGDTRDGTGVAGTGSLVFTDAMAVLVEHAQLQVIGQRWGAVRLFGRAGVGFNVGWVDGAFGGGGAAGVGLGAGFGRGRDVLTLHVSAERLGRVGEAPGETLFGVSLGYAAIWRADD